MKYLSSVFIYVFLMVSCNHENIKQLELKNKDLENQVKALQNKVEFLEAEVLSLEIKKSSLNTIVTEMKEDVWSIKYYAISASNEVSSASFWRDVDSFFFDSAIKTMNSNLNEIIYITSKY